MEIGSYDHSPPVEQMRAIYRALMVYRNGPLNESDFQALERSLYNQMLDDQNGRDGVVANP